MKKHIVLGSIVGLMAIFILSGIAGAISEPPALDRILGHIKTLWEKITVLEASRNPLVKDATGTVIGPLLSGRGTHTDSGIQTDYNYWEIFNTTHKVVGRYEINSGVPVIEQNFGVKFLVFASDDCTGEPYATNVNADADAGESTMLSNMNTLVVRAMSEAENKYYRGKTSLEIEEDFAAESRILPDDSCDTEFSDIFPMAVPVEQIEQEYVGPLSLVP